MHATLFRIFALVFTILLIYTPPSFSQYEDCGKLFHCGNLSNIGYPFWGEERSQNCGYPGFELKCDGDYPVITIQSTPYRLISIDNNATILTVARQDLFNNICPDPSLLLYNSTLDFNLFDYAPNEQNITLFYGCLYDGVQVLPFGFDCTINGNKTYSFYLNGAESLSPLVRCSHTVTVPVSFAAAQELMNPASTVNNLMAALAGGFGLRWFADDVKCGQCIHSGGRCGYDAGSDSFLCYCADRPYGLTCNGTRGSEGRSNIATKAIAGTLAGMGLIAILSIIIYCLRGRLYWKMDAENDQNVETFIKNWGSLAPKQYTYSEIKKLTKSFSEKLGQGGYGSVYKGKLSDGRLVAVKVLNESKGNGEEFINEVATISRTSHVNVVSLLGFCYNRKKALIYQFMPNGSLDKFINKNGSIRAEYHLEWETLYKIAVGIARGLEYLHRGCNTRIVHFDIKPHNILLDEEFCPRISDFGLAKLSERKESVLSMQTARGTAGYIAPEVFFRSFGSVSHKSDVYSYGMMILEMVGVRNRAANEEDIRSSQKYFPNWIYEHLEHGKDLETQVVNDQEEENMARKLLLVGIWCIQTNPSERPSMSKVVEMLEGSLQSLQIPPKPFLFPPPKSPQEYSSSSLSIS